MKNAILVFKLSNVAEWWARKRDKAGLSFAHNIGMWIHEACTVSRKITSCFLWQLARSLLAGPESEAQRGLLKVRTDIPDSYECST